MDDPAVFILRVSDLKFVGSGTLVASSSVVTCAHVTQHYSEADIKVCLSAEHFLKGLFCQVRTIETHLETDLALISLAEATARPDIITGEADDMHIDVMIKAYRTRGDDKKIERHLADGRSVGQVSPRFYRIQGALIENGCSGGAVLSTTGVLLGIVQRTRDPESDQGGWFRGSSKIAEAFPSLSLPVMAVGNSDVNSSARIRQDLGVLLKHVSGDVSRPFRRVALEQRVTDAFDTRAKIVYLLGSPGSGKSLFSIDLAQAFANRGYSVLQGFLRQEIGVQDGFELVRSLLAQAFQFNRSNEQISSVDSALFVQLSNAISHIGKVVVIVDAFDEMNPDHQSRILTLIAGSLGENGLLVVSCRGTIKDKNNSRNLPASEISIGPLSIAEIVELLVQNALDSSIEVARRVFDLTDGIAYSVFGLLRKVAEKEMDLKDIESWGHQHGDLQSRIRSDLLETIASQSTEMSREVLALLVAARYPIERVRLRKLLTIDGVDVDSVVTNLRRFVSGIETVALAHSLVRDVCLDILGDERVRRCLASILALSIDEFRSGKNSQFLTETFLIHLVESGTAELVDVAVDPRVFQIDFSTLHRNRDSSCARNGSNGGFSIAPASFTARGKIS
jgi:Trypsin-like peptidase domain